MEPTPEPYPYSEEQTQMWLRRILDEQMRQSEQLAKIARAAQLYFWLTIIGLIVGICLPAAVFLLSIGGVISTGFFNF
ncbi:MAG TPA: hypothetical protein GYA06_08665 [Chloroflexi bacterium]|nr:hypothetical protein [Chloroflexota bacterium]